MMLPALLVSIALAAPEEPAKPTKPATPPAPAEGAIAAGKPAPEFVLKDQEGKEVKLSSFKGKKNVLLAFYPKDFTGG